MKYKGKKRGVKKGTKNALKTSENVCSEKMFDSRWTKKEAFLMRGYLKEHKMTKKDFMKFLINKTGIFA